MNTQTQATANALQFNDAAACARWAAALPVTNVHLAQQRLTEQYAALAAAQIPALERLKMLEALKEPLMFTQAELAKRYIGKPLPLDKSDALIWDCVTALWRHAGANYRHCLDACRAGDLAIAPHAALVTLRCLRMTALRQFEHYAVYREPDNETWRDFHSLYAFAEERGLARARVPDVFAKHDADSSCSEVYVHGLMAELANPYALPVRQIAFLRRWLDKWAPLIGLANQAVSGSQIPQLAADTAGEAPPGLAAQFGTQPGVRYLDLEQLATTLRQTINLLKQGQTPGQLGLGDDARQPGCENLIMLLYLQWCRAATLRTEERGPVQEPVEVCFGITDSFELMGGDNRTQKEVEFNARDKWEADNLGFSMRLSNTARQAAIKKSEAWEILNKSASGFMCMLREPTGLMRMSHNQLLAVRLGENNTRAGTVQWIRVKPSGECVCGVRLFPGVPRPIKVRPANLNPGLKQTLEPAIIVAEAPMPKTAMTILLPAGWFQAGRHIDTQGETTRAVRLVTLMERGADFDRCTIVAVTQ